MNEIFKGWFETHSPRMVCGRAINLNPPYPNTAIYRGRLIVFCTRYCLEAFQADPDRFYSAHSKSGELSDE